MQINLGREPTKVILLALFYILLSEQTVFLLQLKRFYNFKSESNRRIYDILDIHSHQKHTFLNSILKEPIT